MILVAKESKNSWLRPEVVEENVKYSTIFDGFNIMNETLS